MSKPLDYYAGYPSQQRMPKWIGVVLGTVFGGITLLALAIGIRVVVPPHKAEASVAPPPKAVPADAQAMLAPTPVAAVAAPSAPAPKAHGGRHHGKAGKGRVALAAKAPGKSVKNRQHAELFAKHVATSRKDKRALDDIDKLLQ